MKLHRVLALSLVCLVLSATCNGDVTENEEIDNFKLPSYSENDFHKNLPDQDHFIMFYAPWCGHCQRLKPVWEELFNIMEEDGDQSIAVAKVDCTVETKLCSDQGVLGYPTLKLYPVGKEAVRHKGARDLKSLRSFIDSTLNPEEDEEDLAFHDNGLYQLTAKSFEDHVADGKHFIKFYAPWCGHCKRLEPAWLELAKSHIPSEDKVDDVKIARVDCTEHREVCSKYEVRGYPTLLWFEEGNMVKKYQSGRDIESFEKFIRDMMGTPLQSEDAADEDEDPSVDKDGLFDLVKNNFESHISKGFHFIKFYAPWCGHCRRMEPVWVDLAKSHLPSDEPTAVKIGRVDCTKSEKVCSDYDVKGYPTLLWFEDGKMMKKYQGTRDLVSFESFIAKMTGNEPEEEEVEMQEEAKPTPSPVFNDEPKDAEDEPVLQLDGDNFDFNTAVDVTFVMFYAPWCGFCKRLAPTWEELAVEDFSETQEDVKIAKVDCTKSKDLCQKFEVQGYPTLVLFKDGEKWSKYSGNRSKEDLKTFIIQSVSKKPAAEEKKDEL